MIVFLLTLGGCILVVGAIFWTLWALLKKIAPATADTAIGQQIERVSDKTQDWTALAALRAIRFMDEVEDNPKALAAWQTLYDAIGGTAVSPLTPVVTAGQTAANSQTIVVEPPAIPSTDGPEQFTL